MLPLGFAVAVLCGMAISRGLTAAVIAMVMTLALALPQLPADPVVPAAGLGLFVIPVALLVVSWAWSGDWLLDRAAPGRWLRLGSLLTGISRCCWVSTRVFAPGACRTSARLPHRGPGSTAQSDPLPAGRNAADLYRQAIGVLKAPVLGTSG